MKLIISNNEGNVLKSYLIKNAEFDEKLHSKLLEEYDDVFYIDELYDSTDERFSFSILDDILTIFELSIIGQGDSTNEKSEI